MHPRELRSADPVVSITPTTCHVHPILDKCCCCCCCCWLGVRFQLGLAWRDLAASWSFDLQFKLEFNLKWKASWMHWTGQNVIDCLDTDLGNRKYWLWSHGIGYISIMHGCVCVCVCAAVSWLKGGSLIAREIHGKLCSWQLPLSKTFDLGIGTPTRC